jgi:hypothetical protein
VARPAGFPLAGVGACEDTDFADKEAMIQEKVEGRK